MLYLLVTVLGTMQYPALHGSRKRGPFSSQIHCWKFKIKLHYSVQLAANYLSLTTTTTFSKSVGK
jgi:hypothetical protein